MDPAADLSLDFHWQISFNYFQSELFAAVTGPNKYMYIACEENFLNQTVRHDSIDFTGLN
jgi:hypothetical protein